MFTPSQFDKSLILMINCASVMIMCSMVLFTFYTFIDLPDATSGFWGIGKLSHLVLDHYSGFRF